MKKLFFLLIGIFLLNFVIVQSIKANTIFQKEGNYIDNLIPSNEFEKSENYNISQSNFQTLLNGENPPPPPINIENLIEKFRQGIGYTIPVASMFIDPGIFLGPLILVGLDYLNPNSSPIDYQDQNDAETFNDVEDIYGISIEHDSNRTWNVKINLGDIDIENIENTFSSVSATYNEDTYEITIDESNEILENIGIKSGDIITSIEIDGGNYLSQLIEKDIENPIDTGKAILNMQTIEIEINRDNKTITNTYEIEELEGGLLAIGNLIGKFLGN